VKKQASKSKLVSPVQPRVNSNLGSTGRATKPIQIKAKNPKSIRMLPRPPTQKPTSSLLREFYTKNICSSDQKPKLQNKSTASYKVIQLSSLSDNL
jgi:hypothetical protein